MPRITRLRLDAWLCEYGHSTAPLPLRVVVCVYFLVLVPYTPHWVELHEPHDPKDPTQSLH